MTDIRLLSEYEDVQPFIAEVRKAADRHRESLGFLPSAAYEPQAAAGRLWVAIDSSTNEYAGHLLFGGRFPHLRIFQLFARANRRKKGVGSALIKSLIKHGEEQHYLTLSARVAADLAANGFWERMGFEIFEQKAGGKSRNRLINVRVYDLPTPSLFSALREHEAEPSGITYIDAPVLRSPTYVVDLNVFLDAVRHRPNFKYANALIGAGLDNQVRLCVTPEFVAELDRHKRQDDPLFEFVSQLPTLPESSRSELRILKDELRLIVFPDRSCSGRSAQNDDSDLTHLAYSVIHRAKGFVTNEKAILSSGVILKESYGIEVVSPVDLFVPGQTRASRDYAGYKGHDLEISETGEESRDAVARFLIKSGVPDLAVRHIWDAGTQTEPRRRLCAWREGELVGVASWNSPTRYNKESEIYLLVEQSGPETELVLGHFLESAQRDLPPKMLARFNLVTGSHDSKTHELAIRRGYRRALQSFGARPHELTKVSYGGAIFPEDWQSFCQEFREATGASLTWRMPTYEEFRHTGVQVTVPGGRRFFVSLFDFETLISPGMIMCAGRPGIILPIRRSFADDLLAGARRQQDMFPLSKALLHVEKAYFMGSHRHALFSRGLPLVFYVSGRGGGPQEAIGIARITYAGLISPEESELSLSKQGVLPVPELKSMADSNNRIQAITFDNFRMFTSPVSYDILRSRDWISGANLVTAEPLPAPILVGLVKRGSE